MCIYVYIHDYTDNTIEKHFSLCLSDSQKTFLHTSKNHLNNLLMHIIDFGLLEMLSFRGNFICKPSGYTYTKSYVKHPNENIYALQRQMFRSDLGWQLSRFFSIASCTLSRGWGLTILAKNLPYQRQNFLLDIPLLFSLSKYE